MYHYTHCYNAISSNIFCTANGFEYLMYESRKYIVFSLFFSDHIAGYTTKVFLNLSLVIVIFLLLKSRIQLNELNILHSGLIISTCFSKLSADATVPFLPHCNNYNAANLSNKP